ncbi:MAG: flagellar biosynthetic protein FliR [Proteobacteria bacterium]|nr:MAG: flagellar biosynthetic protein FliR [Pseudomonadota bacterium]
MDALFQQLSAVLLALWWPFCRTLGMLSAAPVIGENLAPITVRVLLALALAVVMMPIAAPLATIEPLSVQAVLVTAEQALIGLTLGLAFHLVMAVVAVLGFTASSQMGLSMAVMNDPMTGMSSDVISSMLYVLSIFVFFAIDGHLVLTGVLGESFRAWPVGGGLPLLTMQSLAFNVAWVFAAAMLLAVPVVFSALVVQLGFGFLNRVAPALNLFSLGFSVIILFGLFMLGYLARTLPEHYVRLVHRVLDWLQVAMR